MIFLSVVVAAVKWPRPCSSPCERGLENDESPGGEAADGGCRWSRGSPRAGLRATEELHETSTISDETWEVLARTLDDKQLIELPMLAGHTHGVAYVQNALKLRLMPGNQGLSAR